MASWHRDAALRALTLCLRLDCAKSVATQAEAALREQLLEQVAKLTESTGFGQLVDLQAQRGPAASRAGGPGQSGHPDARGTPAGRACACLGRRQPP